MSSIRIEVDLPHVYATYHAIIFRKKEQVIKCTHFKLDKLIIDVLCYNRI